MVEDRSAGAQATTVHAGFPSPADDYTETPLVIQDILGEHSATFIMRVQGHSMRGLGIYDNDYLIVDRSKTARHHSIVVACVAGGFVVRELISRQSSVFLVTSDSREAPIYLNRRSEGVEIWGVVTHVIRQLR